jgi:hypothetical protein
MSNLDLISRKELLVYLRKERDDYFKEHFFQDPETGAHEASNAKEEYLEYLDERIDLIENWPSSNQSLPPTSGFRDGIEAAATMLQQDYPRQRKHECVLCCHPRHATASSPT